MKKIFTLLMIAACLVTLCGCGKKESLKESEISKKLSNMGFNVTDVTDRMEDSNISIVKTANNGKYQIEYYVFKNKENTKTAFDSNVALFEEDKEHKGRQKNKDNYDRYDQKNDYYYNVVSRVDNILIYVSINKDYKNDVKKVLNKLGF